MSTKTVLILCAVVVLFSAVAQSNPAIRPINHPVTAPKEDMKTAETVYSYWAPSSLYNYRYAAAKTYAPISYSALPYYSDWSIQDDVPLAYSSWPYYK